MKLKILLPAILVLFSFAASAQTGFFSRMPKLQERPKINLNPIISSTDSIFFAVRPVASLLAYSVPNGNLQGGAGVGVQRLDYKYATQTYYCNYSLNLIGFAGGNVAPVNPTGVVSVGVLAGVLNNTIMAGPAYNFAPTTSTKRWNLMVSIGISFNN